MTIIHINIEIAKPEDEEKFILGLKSLADALVQKEYFVCPPNPK
jgi:hypothetical protein